MHTKYFCSTEFVLETEEERRKYQRLYENYASAMYQAAYAVLKNPHLAEDVVHDCFLILVQHLKKIQEEQVCQTKKFLLKMAKNYACTMRKHGKREFPQENILEFLPSEKETPEHLAIDEEMKQNLLIQISRLKEQDRELLTWFYLYEIPTKEIAKRLHRSQASVRKRLQRAREALKKGLEKEGGDWRL